MEDVLVLYNQVNTSDSTFQESRGGVLDQVRAVLEALDKLGIPSESLAVENLQHLVSLLKLRKEKLIFNLIEEFPGSSRDACAVPALCEAFGAGCTGSGTEALFLAQDKARTRAILTAAGLPCPMGLTVEPGRPFPMERLKKGIYIIKPACSDASEGIGQDSVVTIPSRQAAEKVEKIHQEFHQAAIVEQFIPARELNVSIIETAGKTRVLPLAEIDFSAFPKGMPRIVDYQAKWIKDSFAYQNTPRIIPAPLEEPLAEKIRTLAIQAWQALDCRGYARVDFRLDEKNQPYILEINPNPDISPDAGFAAALAAAQIPYERFVWLMLRNAIQTRNRNALSTQNGASL
ncbi:MAG TPA: ATP-grasp domain-containing protein [Anaerohalosphaeraceae bacterium]|nr:ATP-grasp domain-containing protein [Anaerohalosphaeraceae bacterium]HOL89299.1 ATP-grasp domain-containing protein [Anaerohalosphaeraceae bacterium]HPP56884.1 ATP-grasp domain-containing protein [Anaerohalosphaeraceae bacterium]